MMEMIAMHLKAQGSYISRSLSYSGCQFETVEDAVGADAIAVYDAAAVLWQELLRELREALNSDRLEFRARKSKKRGSYDSDSDDIGKCCAENT